MAGILIRVVWQFYFPVFNVDEVHLGLNIVNRNWSELFFPLSYGQSAPPLFLIIAKLFTTFNNIPSWALLKSFSFSISILILCVFYALIRKEKYSIEFFLPFIILTFNPYIIYNSLTLKQYGLDLLGILLIIYFFNSQRFKSYSFILLIVWTFFSNASIIAAIGVFFYMVSVKFYSREKFDSKFFFLISRPIMALVPYTIYYFWFMRQHGASALREYMLGYWGDFFMPVNTNIFSFIITQIHSVYITFLSAFEVVGFSVAAFVFFSIILIIKKGSDFKDKNVIVFLTICGITHLLLSLFKIYPFGDRLIFYLLPLILFALSTAIRSNIICPGISIKKKVGATSLVFLMTYSCYFDYRDNDVVSVYRFLERNKPDDVFLTEQVKLNFDKFDSLTSHYFKRKIDDEVFSDNINYSQFVLTRAAKKLNPNKTANDRTYDKLISDGMNLILVKQIGGYNLYRVN